MVWGFDSVLMYRLKVAKNFVLDVGEFDPPNLEGYCKLVGDTLGH